MQGVVPELMQGIDARCEHDRFQADILATRAQYERLCAILCGMGVGWTPSFLSTCYPRASRNLIASFVKDIRKLSIGLVLALYVTFADLRLHRLLALIAMIYGRLGDFSCFYATPNNCRERVENSTRSWKAPHTRR